MKVNRTELLRALHSVEMGLTDTPVFNFRVKIPSGDGYANLGVSSHCFSFGAGLVVTFHEHLMCRSPTGLGDGVEGCVPAKKFKEVVSSLSAEELEVEQGDGKLIVYSLSPKSARTAKSWFAMEQGATGPVSKDPAGPLENFAPIPDGLLSALDLCRRCVGRDQDRETLTCVHITPKWVEASDNMQAVRWPIRTGMKESVLVGGKWLKAATSQEITTWSLSDNWLHFGGPGGLVISCRRHVDDYKDLTPFYTVDGDVTALPKSLADAAAVAKLFSSENDSDRVRVDLRPGKVTVSGEGRSGGYKETRKVQYDGEPLSFFVSPDILSDIVSKRGECVIGERRLQIEAEGYSYILSLILSEEKVGA